MKSPLEPAPKRSFEGWKALYKEKIDSFIRKVDPGLTYEMTQGNDSIFNSLMINFMHTTHYVLPQVLTFSVQVPLNESVSKETLEKRVRIAYRNACRASGVTPHTPI